MGTASKQALTSHRDAQQLGLDATPEKEDEDEEGEAAAVVVAVPAVEGSTRAAAAESATGRTGLELGSSVESRGSSPASFKWLRRFL